MLSRTDASISDKPSAADTKRANVSQRANLRGFGMQVVKSLSLRVHKSCSFDTGNIFEGCLRPNKF